MQAIVVAVTTATVTAMAAMVTATAGVVAFAAKATELTSVVALQQCTVNTTISLKSDTRQRCQRQRQATGNNQPAQQKEKRVVQHKCQHNNSNRVNDSRDCDSSNNDNNDGNYVDGSSQHQRLMAMVMKWMRMVRVLKQNIERLNMYC